jgi:hypothetical protein
VQYRRLNPHPRNPSTNPDAEQGASSNTRKYPSGEGFNAFINSLPIMKSKYSEISLSLNAISAASTELFVTIAM